MENKEKTGRDAADGDGSGEKNREKQNPGKPGICYIVGAGEHTGNLPKPKPGDFVIAADGGYAYLEEQGMKPDLVLGDFDSLGKRPDHPCVLELSSIKDDTDMIAALKTGMDKGYRLFYLYGGMGGRLDHTIANLQSLAWLSERGARGFLFGARTAATAITDSSMEFGEEYAGYISVFSNSDSSLGVYLEGLKYELTDARLDNRFPLGVSNEFTGVKSRVTVGRGTLLILYTLPEK